MTPELSCFYQLMCYDFAMPANEYLHSYQNESLGELESQRLSLLNSAYAPKAHAVLEPYFSSSRINVLELGVGTGEMGVWLASKAAKKGQYIGIDKDPAQLAKANTRISGQHVKLLQLDLLSMDDFDRLLIEKSASGFDLIYCRWLLCHIREEERITLINQIAKLLSPTGVFIAEEPDYRTLHLKVNNFPIEDPSIIIEWKEIVKNLQKNTNLGLDLEMDPEKLRKIFKEAVQNIPNAHIEIIEQTLPVLVNEQKYALVFGLKTAKKSILSIGKTEESFGNLLHEYEKIAEDPRKSIAYYANTFIKLSFHRIEPG